MSIMCWSLALQPHCWSPEAGDGQLTVKWPGTSRGKVIGIGKEEHHGD